MKISARNRLKGKVVEVTKGATTAHVRIDIGNGSIVTSSITNEAVDELGLTVGALNIADKDPPVYTTSSGVGIQSTTDPSTYDVLGRRYFLSLTA